MPDSKPVEAMGEVERLAYVRDGLRQLAATPENEWPVRNTLLSWLELQAATIDQALDSLRGVEIETDDEGYVFITITTDPSAAGHAVIVNGRNVDPGEPEGGAREALERIKPQAVKAMAVELSMDEPIHYVGHAFDRVVEIAVEALALSGGREQPEGPWDENGIPSVDDDENHSSVPTSREQPAGLRETLIVAHEALVQVCPPYTNRMQRIVDEAKAAVLEVLASPDQESERAPCGRLLVGRGDDTYDPECGLPRGHSGPCEPEVSRPLPAAGLSEEAIEAAERATATAEKLIDAITEISGHLNDDRLADKAKIFKVRLVIVRLDQGGQDDRDT